MKQLADELQPLLSDFEHGLNVIAKLPITSEADKRLVKNVRMALVGRAQQWLPPWRILSQAARRMPLPPDPKTVSAQKVCFVSV